MKATGGTMGARVARASQSVATMLLVVSAAVVVYAAAMNIRDSRGRVRDIAGWEELARTGHVLDATTHPVRIVVFTDYQCEACGTMHQLLADLRGLHPDRVWLAVHHYPMDLVHEYAVSAALAASCAAKQGRFAAMNDLLHLKREQLGVRPWEAFAREASVPSIDHFEQCISSPRALEEVRADSDIAKRLGLAGTPAVIVEGKLFYGPEALGYASNLLGRR